jgi:uncharacterized protein
VNAHGIPIDRADLKALDAYLSSDRGPENGMMLSDLDGFLTGIAIGPELVMPREWLPVVWGGDEPDFADETEAKLILGSIMARYNHILRQIEESELDPVFWATRDGTVIAADWAEGFLQAIYLHIDAWEPLFMSKRDQDLLFPILALCGDENGESLLGLSDEDEDWAIEKAEEWLPASVLAIAAYWRKKRESFAPVVNAMRDVGRNDPCPCGSRKKFKKCCGRSD